MSSVKSTISWDKDTLRRIDELVERTVFPSRSRAIQTAIVEKLASIPGQAVALDGTMALVRTLTLRVALLVDMPGTPAHWPLTTTCTTWSPRATEILTMRPGIGAVRLPATPAALWRTTSSTLSGGGRCKR